MSEIEAALNTYLETKENSEIDLENVPYRARPGFEGRKNEAKDNLKAAMGSYIEAVKKNAFGIVVSGPGTESFVRNAKAEVGSLLVVDLNSLYFRVADRVAETMGLSGEFGVSQFSTVIQELRMIGNEMGLFSVNGPKWIEPANVGTSTGLARFISNMLDSSLGPDFMALYLEKQLGEGAVTLQTAKSVVPVVVIGLSKDFQGPVSAKLFQPGRIQFVETETQEVTLEQVIEIMTNIKKSLKSNKSTQTNKAT